MDISILRELQEDCARPLHQIADAVHLSRNACWRRIQRLERAGIIKRRVAIVDADKVGLEIAVFVVVQTNDHSVDWLERFIQCIQEIPEVVELYRTSGETDYLLKIVVADLAAYDAVYKRLIRLSSLTNVSAMFALEQIKHCTVLPVAVF